MIQLVFYLSETVQFGGQRKSFPVDLNWDFGQFGIFFLLDIKEISITINGKQIILHCCKLSDQW